MPHQRSFRSAKPMFLLILFVTSCGIAGVPGSSRDHTVGRVFDRVMQKVNPLSGNFNLASAADRKLPVPAPSDLATRSPCRGSTGNTAQLTGGRLVLRATSNSEAELRGDASLSYDISFLCRGERMPHPQHYQSDGRYVVYRQTDDNVLNLYFPDTGLTVRLVERENGTSYVLLPDELLFVRGRAPADSAAHRSTNSSPVRR